MTDNCQISQLFSRFKSQFTSNAGRWQVGRGYLFILLGSFVQALSMRMFLVPALLVSGGVSGIAQIINFFTFWPIGLMVFLGNIPMFVLGWRHLGGKRFMARTIVAIVSFSFFTDFLVLFISPQGMTDDLFLNAIYGGVLLGVGLGLVYLGQGTSGGSDILSRILNHRFGFSISQAYLLTDTIVVLGSALAFDWERALYGLVVIYVSGLAAEMISEGPRIYRSVMIVTSRPGDVAAKILKVLERGATILPGTGAFTGNPRPVLYCVVTRSEVSQLKMLVMEEDPYAFMVVGIAHEAFGEGFVPLKPRF